MAEGLGNQELGIFYFFAFSIYRREKAMALNRALMSGVRYRLEMP